MSDDRNETTALATRDDTPRPAPIVTGGALAAFVPTNLAEVWRLSTALASSNMTPKAYNNDPNRIMVGIMAGAELGLTPFAALQSIAVIGNNPAVWGDGMLALCEASGKLEDIEETDDGQVATCRVVRRGRKTPIVRSFGIEDAKKAGLSGKSGPWTQYPARMRQMRARAFALRDAFADVLRGIKSAEEVRDYAPVDAAPTRDGGAVTADAILEQARPAEAYDAETGEVARDAAPVVEQEEAQPRRAKQTPAQQVDAYIAAIKNPEIVATRDDLQAYQLDERRAAWLATLREKHPAEHERVVEANSARLAALDGSDEGEDAERDLVDQAQS